MKYHREYRILDSQIDVTGHMSNVEYYSYFKTLFFSFLNEIKFTQLVGDKDLWPIVFDESCKFKKEIYFDDIITVSFSFTEIKTNKWSIIGEIHNENGELCAEYISNHGILNRNIRKIDTLPVKAVSAILEYFEDSSA